MSDTAFEPERIVVTGGCGFIGSNFVHHVVREHPGVHVTVLDKLTYAGNPDNIAGLPSDRVELVVGDICDADARRPPRVRDRRRGPLRRRVPQRQLHRGPVPVPQDQRRGHLHPHRGLPQTRRALPPRLHRRGLRRPGARRPGPLHRGDALPPELPVQLHQGELRPAGARLGPHLRLAATISNCSNNYGPYQHVEKFIPRQVTNLIDGVRPKLYGDGRNVRDWIHTEDHSSAVWTILTRGRVGETYLIGADGELDNITVSARDPQGLRPPRGRLRLGARPPRPRPALRDRRDQAQDRARLGALPHRLRRRPRGDDPLVPRQRGLVAPGQGGHRGEVRRSGAVAKTSPEAAPSNLYIVGRYLLSPLVMELLANQQPGKGNEIQLTDAMARSLDREAMWPSSSTRCPATTPAPPPAGSPPTPSWPRPTPDSRARSGRPSTSAVVWSDRLVGFFYFCWPLRE